MTIDRAIEILDPEHRENYDGMDEVNEACRMGMEALGGHGGFLFQMEIRKRKDAIVLL